MDVDYKSSGKDSWDIVISDNGSGIADMSVLLNLLQSDFPDDVVSREDAAGMGFFSLAGDSVSNVRVSSRGVQADFPRDSFFGLAEVETKPDSANDGITRVSFSISGYYELQLNSALDVLSYAPFDKIRINGNLKENWGFANQIIGYEAEPMPDFGVVVHWAHGVAYWRRAAGYGKCRVYQAGVKLDAEVHTPELLHKSYIAFTEFFSHLRQDFIVEIVDSSKGIRMQLPDRNRLVKSQVWDRLIEEIVRRAVGRAAKSEHYHTLPFFVYARMKELEPDFPESAVYGKPYDSYKSDHRRFSALAPLEGRHTIYASDKMPYALEHLGFDSVVNTIVVPSTHVKYSWAQEMTRVGHLNLHIDDRCFIYDEVIDDPRLLEPWHEKEPDRIYFSLPDGTKGKDLEALWGIALGEVCPGDAEIPISFITAAKSNQKELLDEFVEMTEDTRSEIDNEANYEQDYYDNSYLVLMRRRFGEAEVKEVVRDKFKYEVCEKIANVDIGEALDTRESVMVIATRSKSRQVHSNTVVLWSDRLRIYHAFLLLHNLETKDKLILGDLRVEQEENAMVLFRGEERVGQFHSLAELSDLLR